MWEVWRHVGDYGRPAGDTPATGQLSIKRVEVDALGGIDVEQPAFMATVAVFDSKREAIQAYRGLGGVPIGGWGAWSAMSSDHENKSSAELVQAETLVELGE